MCLPPLRQMLHMCVCDCLGSQLPCPSGRFGNTTGQTSPLCSGICSDGYECEGGSTSPTAAQCQAGYVCASGLKSPCPAYVDSGSDSAGDSASGSCSGSQPPSELRLGRRTCAHAHSQPHIPLSIAVFHTHPHTQNTKHTSNTHTHSLTLGRMLGAWRLWWLCLCGPSSGYYSASGSTQCSACVAGRYFGGTAGASAAVCAPCPIVANAVVQESSASGAGEWYGEPAPISLSW